jgi:hypothetical protein
VIARVFGHRRGEASTVGFVPGRFALRPGRTAERMRMSSRAQKDQPWWIWAYDRTGLTLWFTLLAVVCVLVILSPDTRSVVPNYRFASHSFMDGSSPYRTDALAGFLYVPAFAVIYMPFAALGSSAGDALWRILGFLLLTFAAWRQMDEIPVRNRVRYFSIACLLALPLTAGAVRNGQATILMLATVWLMFQAAGRGRGVEAALWAGIAIVVKPTALVAVMLVAALFPFTIGYIAAAFLLVLALPFAFAPTDYVVTLYRDFAALLSGMQMGDVEKFLPADISRLLAVLGIAPPPLALLAIRALAGLAVLAGALAIRWKMQSSDRTLILVVIAVFYMSVFNPRQETNTYAQVALPFALFIAVWLERAPRSVGAWAAAILVFSLGLTGVVHGHVRHIVHWWYPLWASVAFAMIMSRVALRAAPEPVEAQPRRGGME